MSKRQVYITCHILLIGACASQLAPSPGRSPQIIPCHTIEAVNLYAEEVANRASERLSEGFAAPAREEATLAVRIETDGSVISADAIAFSSEEAKEGALRAVMLAAPYASFPSAHRQCIAVNPLLLFLAVRLPFDCETSAAVKEYYESVIAAVARTLDEHRYRYSPGYGRVRFGVLLEPNGAIRSVSFLDQVDQAAADKVARAIDSSSPFDPPPHYAECFAGLPMVLWLDVPGY